MLLIILGLILWTGAHYWKRLAPDHRAKLGGKGKGIVAGASVLAIVLMIIGYRSADFIAVWNPPSALQHITHVLMLAAFFVFGMSATTGRLRGYLRHPMLISVKTWAIAHLLVNGDLAAIILFGGMLAWAVGSVILINKAEPNWVRPEPGNKSKDILLVVITLVTFTIAVAIHIALGVNPFG
jgi:uncharacterized membrane protein